MTYFQLISILRTVDIKIPSFLPSLSFYFGNPATNTTLNANCFMPSSLLNVPYIYYNYFISLLVPIFHFTLLIIILKILTILNKEILSKSDLKASVIFLFTYFQPEFVFQAVQIITCKKIDDEEYIQANLSLKCNLDWSYTLILSLIICFFCIIIPGMLFFKLRWQIHRLANPQKYAMQKSIKKDLEKQISQNFIKNDIINKPHSKSIQKYCMSDIIPVNKTIQLDDPTKREYIEGEEKKDGEENIKFDVGYGAIDTNKDSQLKSKRQQVIEFGAKSAISTAQTKQLIPISNGNDIKQSVMTKSIGKILYGKQYLQDDYIPLNMTHFAFFSENYKKNRYYWEFIRMGERLIFLLFASLLNQNPYVLLIFIVFLCELYSYLLIRMKPFKNEKFNKIEIVCNQIIAASFLLSIGEYSKQLGDAFDTIFYLSFLMLNVGFIIYLLSIIIQSMLAQISVNLIDALSHKTNMSPFGRTILNCIEKVLIILNKLPCLKLVDLELYLRRKNKPHVFAKAKQILFAIARMDPHDRQIYFLAIKEQSNPNKYLSNYMSNLTEQMKQSRKGSSQQLIDGINQSYQQQQIKESQARKGDVPVSNFKLTLHKSNTQNRSRDSKEMEVSIVHSPTNFKNIQQQQLSSPTSFELVRVQQNRFNFNYRAGASPDSFRMQNEEAFSMASQNPQALLSEFNNEKTDLQIRRQAKDLDEYEIGSPNLLISSDEESSQDTNKGNLKDNERQSIDSPIYEFPVDAINHKSFQSNLRMLPIIDTNLLSVQYLTRSQSQQSLNTPKKN